MVEFRDQQQDTLLLRGFAQGELHGEALGQSFHRAPDGGLGLALAQPVEDHAHEEAAGLGIVELLRVEDVAAGLEQQAGDGGNDARTVGAGQSEDGGVLGHGDCRRCGRPFSIETVGWCEAGEGGARRAALNLGRRGLGPRPRSGN